jgi:hypothetical protein
MVLFTSFFPMKMPRGIFITYICDVVGSSEVNMEMACAGFILLYTFTKGIIYV